MRFATSTRLLALIVSGALASGAHAQWVVSYLHPAGALQSFGNGVSGVDQVGYIKAGANNHGALWTGSAASFVDMNPASAIASILNGTDGVRQAGEFSPVPTIPPSHSYMVNFAAIWSSTPASMVNIQPSGGGYEPVSSAVAIEGDLQTGYYAYTSEPSTPGAARWNGSAASYAGLATPGLTSRCGLGTDGSSIVGRAAGSGGFHATLWTFGPTAFVDLNPAGSTSSEAYDVEGNIQVGYADLNGGSHAAIWSGTAASVVDMNPVGATTSVLRGADDSYQVGSATFPGSSSNAGIWSGTAGSFLNLHALLAPGAYSSSQANGVWTDGTTIKVVGTAFNTGLARSEAVLWTVTVPEPATLSLLSAIGLVGACLGRRRVKSAI